MSQEWEIKSCGRGCAGTGAPFADGQSIYSCLQAGPEGYVRKDFSEPRIHFAIVCASRSCPELRSEAYRAKILDAQLTQAARRFIADPSKNRFDAGARTLKLSSIFDWFREDFERSSKTLPAFIANYSEPALAAALASGQQPRLEFLDYDWSLNGS